MSFQLFSYVKDGCMDNWADGVYMDDNGASLLFATNGERERECVCVRETERDLEGRAGERVLWSTVAICCV